MSKEQGRNSAPFTKDETLPLNSRGNLNTKAKESQETLNLNLPKADEALNFNEPKSKPDAPKPD